MRRSRFIKAIVVVFTCIFATTTIAATDPNTAVSTQLLVPVLKSKSMPKKERLQALHTIFRARKSLSKSEQLEAR